MESNSMLIQTVVKLVQSVAEQSPAGETTGKHPAAGHSPFRQEILTVIRVDKQGFRKQ